MKIISLPIIFVILLAVFFLLEWKHTEWKKIDEANKEFYDADGDHIHYDKTRIRMKKEVASKKEI